MRDALQKNNASINGRLDVVKYLYETCHATISDDIINIASQKFKDYLLSLRRKY